MSRVTLFWLIVASCGAIWANYILSLVDEERAQAQQLKQAWGECRMDYQTCSGQLQGYKVRHILGRGGE